MSRVLMAALLASAVAMSGCGRDRDDQAQNQYGDNKPASDVYGSAERYSDPNMESRTGSSAQAGEFVVPQDTFILVSLNDTLNSQTAKKGDEFTAEVIEPVKVNEDEAIPAGATIHGVVKEVYDPASGTTGASNPYAKPDETGSKPGSQSGSQSGSSTAQSGSMGSQQPGQQPMDPSKARLTLSFTRIELPNGTSANIVASLPEPSELQMARNRGLGGGSSAGGEVLGRRPDDQKDAIDKAEQKMKDLPADIHSGTVGTGIVVAKSSQHVNLPAGTELTVQLDEPLRISKTDRTLDEQYKDKDKKDREDWEQDPNRK
jgi:hypothetical protein